MGTCSTRLERPLRSSYHHSEWQLRRRFIRLLMNSVLNLLLRVGDVQGLENVPERGAALLMINHIAFVDPIVVLKVLQRDAVPLAKHEIYGDPWIGVFPRIWGAIPVHRGEVDREALRRALAVLQAGELLLVAPEGTRNPALQRGKEGLAFLASRTGAPVVPVAVECTEAFPSFWFLRRPPPPGAAIRFGRPFRFRPELQRPNRELMRQMTDEAMYVLASMLPERRRGVYSDLSRATESTIEWL